MFFDLKNIITAFFIFLALPIFAQNELTGAWYGIVVSDGSIKKIAQIWKFDGISLEMGQVHDKYNSDPKSRKTRKFKYKILNDKLILKRNDLDYAISITKREKHNIVLNDTIQNLTFFLQKQDVETVRTPDIKESLRLSLFQINTINNEFQDFQIAFVQFDNKIYMKCYKDYKYLKGGYLKVKENRIQNYNLDTIGIENYQPLAKIETDTGIIDPQITLFDNYGKDSVILIDSSDYTTLLYELNLLFFNIYNDSLISIVINRIDETGVYGLANGNIPFTLNELKPEGLFKKEDFKNRSFVGDVLSTEKILYSDLKKTARTITVGKNKITFISDTTAIMKLYEREIIHSIDTGFSINEEMPDTKVFSYEGKWYLDELGQNLYIHYFDTKRYRKRVIQFQIEKEDNKLILTQNMILSD